MSPFGTNFSLQEDNVALEYNTKPAMSGDEWFTYHTYMRKYIRDELVHQGLEPAILASHVFDEDELNHPKAWIFGCEPDYNAWDKKINPAPRSKEPRLRSAGGHIHFGYTDPTKSRSILLCRIADLFIGLPLMVFDPDSRRMELYGKAGAMRFKPYGFEYRTPSNFWTSTPELVSWVYNQAEAVLSFNGVPPQEIQLIINQQDKAAAKDAMKHFGVSACPV